MRWHAYGTFKSRRREIEVAYVKLNNLIKNEKFIFTVNGSD